jgi:hypothetical protein
MMKRAILFALMLVAAIAPVAGVAYAGYGPVTEVPATLNDVQAP